MISVVKSVFDSLIAAGVTKTVARKYKHIKKEKEINKVYEVWIENEKKQPYYDALERALNNSKIIDCFIASVIIPEREFNKQERLDELFCHGHYTEMEKKCIKADVGKLLNSIKTILLKGDEPDTNIILYYLKELREKWDEKPPHKTTIEAGSTIDDGVPIEGKKDTKHEDITSREVIIQPQKNKWLLIVSVIVIMLILLVIIIIYSTNKQSFPFGTRATQIITEVPTIYVESMTPGITDTQTPPYATPVPTQEEIRKSIPVLLDVYKERPIGFDTENSQHDIPIRFSPSIKEDLSYKRGECSELKVYFIEKIEKQNMLEYNKKDEWAFVSFLILGQRRFVYIPNEEIDYTYDSSLETIKKINQLKAVCYGRVIQDTNPYWHWKENVNKDHSVPEYTIEADTEVKVFFKQDGRVFAEFSCLYKNTENKKMIPKEKMRLWLDVENIELYYKDGDILGL